MLEVRDVTVAFDGTTVLRDASLSVSDAEVVALLGPSGSGKSTLLRVIAGLVVPAAGSVHLDGRDITRFPTHRRGIGMVFQDDQLFPHRDVAANIGFGLKMQGIAAPDRERRVDTMLELVGLAGFGGRHVTDLSGGEAEACGLGPLLGPRAPCAAPRRAADRARPRACTTVSPGSSPAFSAKPRPPRSSSPTTATKRPRSPIGW